jgi:hypothetical protein
MTTLHDDRLFDADFLKSIITYDPITGIFTWKYRYDVPKNWNSKHAFRVAGTISKTTGYTVIQIGKGLHYNAARLAWLYMTGKWPTDQIDHKNLIRDDDRFENLREATNSQNNSNKRAQSNNQCGHRGIYLHNGKVWRARINHNGKQIELGCFVNLEDAIDARKKAEEKYHGKFIPPTKQ